VGRNFSVSPGLDFTGLSSAVRPTMPTFTPPMSRISLSLKPSMGLSVGSAEVRGEERKFRLLHALHEDVGAEIELMVAGREDVRRRHVGERDRVLALVEAREQGRRDQVARMGIDHVAALGALGLHHRVQPREAAALGGVVHLVDVVRQQEGDVDRPRQAPKKPGLPPESRVAIRRFGSCASAAS
jgi:hypothetical protein